MAPEVLSLKFAWSELGVFGPELALVGAIVAVLALPLVRDKRSNVVAGATAGLGLFAAIFFLLGVNSWGELAAHPMAHAAGGGVGGLFFGGLLVMDPLAWLFKLSLLVFGLIAVGLWMVATRDGADEGEGTEFFALFLTALVGLMLTASTTNLLMLWVALELAALPGYALVSFSRRGPGKRCAAMNWALWGMVCSAIMVYGISMLYGLSGSLELSALRHVPVGGAGGPRWAMIIGLAGLLVGVGGKVMMAPLHGWAVAAVERAPLEVGALLAVGYTGAGLAVLLRIVATVSGIGAFDVAGLHGNFLAIAVLVLGALTCFWANIAALKQNNIKRLLAYSSMTHTGYMLLAVAMAAGGNTVAIEGWLFYLGAYVFMTGGAFAAAAAIQQRIGRDDLDAYAGLGLRYPILAGAMAVMICSLIGVPMTIGFGAKLKLCQVFFEGGGAPGSHWLGFAGLGILAVSTVLGAVTYLRVVRQMYFVKTDLPREFEIVPATLLAGALAAVNIALFVGYGWMEAGVRAFGEMWRG